MTKTWIQILIMTGVTFLIRVIPLTLFRKPIKNEWLKSFLTYVPYVTLAVMTVPAMVECTGSIYSGILALIAGIILAWNGASLFGTCSVCCIAVLLAEAVLV